MQSLREFITTIPALPKMLKGIVQAEMKQEISFPNFTN